MKPKFLIQLVLVAVLLLAGGCAKEPKRKVVVGYLPIIAHLPAEMAREGGYFGPIEVEYRVFGSSNDLLEALGNGQIDITMTVAVAPVVGRYQQTGGQAMVKIFSYSQTTADNPFDGLFVARESKITTLADLSGKRIGVFPGTTAKNILSHFLKQHAGIDPQTIKWVFLPPNLQISRLRDGDIDALFTYETVRTTAELNGFRSLHGSVIATVFPDAPYGCSAVNTKFAEEFPELAAKVIAAFDRGIVDVRDHPEAARQVLIRKFELGTEVAAKCYLEKRVTSDRINAPENAGKFEGFLTVLKASGELSASLDAAAATQAVLWRKR